MEFPFGGHHHHHHHRPGGEPNPDENPDRYPHPNPNPFPPPGQDPYGYRPAPPPAGPYYSDFAAGGGPTGYAPPPAVHHVSHEYGRPDYYPPAPEPHVHHVSHQGPGGGFGYDNQRPDPYFPGAANVEHVSHVSHGVKPPVPEWAGQRTVRVYSRADEGYSLSIREGQVVLAPSNPRDDHQHWIKDMRYSTKVKDEEGLPSFALVNKATGEAIKHAIGATHPVRLVPYNPDYLDESILWTESYDTGEGFRCIRMVNNIRLNFDAFHGDEDHGGVRDGTKIVLWEWLKGKNQRWKIVPY